MPTRRRGPHGPAIAHRAPGRVRFLFGRGELTAERVAGIRRALGSRPEVTRFRINPAAYSVVVDFDPAVISVGRLRRIVADAPDAQAGENGDAPRGRSSHVPALVSIAAGGLLAMAGQPLALPLLAAGASPIFGRAARRLIDKRKVGVDALDAAALTLTIGTGQVVTAAVMAGLVEAGEWMRDLTAARSRRALGALMLHETATCLRVAPGRRARIRVLDVRARDEIALGPGDRIPVDGDVVKGVATVDERLLTGEPMPVTKEAGSQVFAMTVVTDGEIRVRAAGRASESRAGRIMAFLEAAPIGDTRMADHARRFADRFVLPVMGLAAGAYLLTGSASRAASILIFDLATGIRVAAPTTMLAALIGAARDGVLIKGASAIERLAHVDTIVFDKTGTLTVGEPQVVDVQTFNGLPPRDLVAIAAAADEGVNHPLATALVAEARRLGVEPPRRTSFRYHVGRGVEAMFGGGRKFLVGNRDFMTAMRLPVPEDADRPAVSEVFVATPDECLGAVYFRDTARADAAGIMRDLRGLGIDRVVMLSGDTNASAARMAADLGITEWRGRFSPHAKAEFVKQLQAEGRVVAMVGDGVNDSMAFALADVPIAMGEGADVARATAQVVLLENRLELLPVAVRRAREALRILNQNFGLIAAPNAVGLGGALITSMNPAIAALLNNGSAVAAAANGLRPMLPSARKTARERPASASPAPRAVPKRRSGRSGRRSSSGRRAAVST
jgi:P-type Cu2+ transporter